MQFLQENDQVGLSPMPWTPTKHVLPTLSLSLPTATPFTPAGAGLAAIDQSFSTGGLGMCSPPRGHLETCGDSSDCHRRMSRVETQLAQQAPTQHPTAHGTAPTTKHCPIPSADSGEVRSHRQSPVWGP